MSTSSRNVKEFYKGARGPLALHHLLHLIWTNAKSLAGYEQKDAHEFFPATLDVLHRLGTMPALEPTKDKQKCKGVSTAIDPISVVSLDLACSQLGSAPPSSPADCLKRYTRIEHLGSSAKILCSNCDSYQESTKQLTVKTLPVVVSFRFKRSKNISTHL